MSLFTVDSKFLFEKYELFKFERTVKHLSYGVDKKAKPDEGPGCYVAMS
jgi:hypothetical protein